MNLQVSVDDFASMTEEQRAYIRTLGKAWAEAADARKVVAAQDERIAALLQELKRQAFQLGDQDRDLRDAKKWIVDLEAKVAELQAGDVGRLRQTVDFQAMEIQRLKAAAANRDRLLGECLTVIYGDAVDMMAGTATATVEDQAIAAKLDAYAGKVAALTADLAERDRLLRECQAERDAARRKLALKSNAMLAGQKRIAELESTLGDMKGQVMIKDHYAAGLLDSLKALNDDLTEKKATIRRQSEVWGTDQQTIRTMQADVERLKGVADHSNNLAHARLEELAKLRKELAAAKEEFGKLREEAAQLQGAIAEREGMILAQSHDLKLWRHVADRATRVRFQRLRDSGFDLTGAASSNGSI